MHSDYEKGVKLEAIKAKTQFDSVDHKSSSSIRIGYLPGADVSCISASLLILLVERLLKNVPK